LLTTLPDHLAHPTTPSAQPTLSIRFRKIELFYDLFNRGGLMRYIGKSKISTLHPKPDISYPLIRLPQQYKHLIGETAQLFITNHEGKKGFFDSS